jgi:hypothetical protein
MRTFLVLLKRGEEEDAVSPLAAHSMEYLITERRERIGTWP